MRALVCGAGGFIGGHLVKRLKNEGYWVRGVDLKYPEFGGSAADEFLLGDLRSVDTWTRCLRDYHFDEAYQLAADMGGAGYIFSGESDSHVMHNSAMINLHMADCAVKSRVGRVFYSSSACMYPAYNQEDASNPNCEESSAYPAAPDSEYGWEKLFSERLYFALQGITVLRCELLVSITFLAPKGPGREAKRRLPQHFAERWQNKRRVGRS
jgi:GDP-D-mannose 3',5'-epimerase